MGSTVSSQHWSGSLPLLRRLPEPPAVEAQHISSTQRSSYTSFSGPGGGPWEKGRTYLTRWYWTGFHRSQGDSHLDPGGRTSTRNHLAHRQTQLCRFNIWAQLESMLNLRNWYLGSISHWNGGSWLICQIVGKSIWWLGRKTVLNLVLHVLKRLHWIVMGVCQACSRAISTALVRKADPTIAT